MLQFKVLERKTIILSIKRIICFDDLNPSINLSFQMEHENYLRGDLSNSNKPPIVRQKYSNRTSGQQPIKSHTLNPGKIIHTLGKVAM